MPRKRKGWNPANKVVPVQGSLATSTLANLVVVKAAIGGTGTQEYKCISTKLMLAMRDFTAGEGPITVGLAHGDYTVAEIEECLEAESAIDMSDMVAAEQAGRRVRRIAVFGQQAASVEIINDGRPVRTKLNWKTEGDVPVAIWIYNHSGSALSGGAVLEWVGTQFIRFL